MKNSQSVNFKGQIIVLFAVVLVALLGFTALAVDGGMIYSDRRAAQNSADSAAMAAGGKMAQWLENSEIMYDNFSCANLITTSKGSFYVSNGMSDAATEAYNRALSNNYTIEFNLDNKNGVQVTCHSVDEGPYIDHYIDFTIMITAPTNTSFAQLFYSGEVKNTVTAKVRVHPRTSLGYGYSVASMGTDCTTGGIHGNGNVLIDSTNGGVFSNSCFDFTSNKKTYVTVDDPDGSGCRYYSGTVSPSWCDVPIVQSPVQLDPYVIPAPDCGALSPVGAFSGSGTINPGIYTTISTGGGANLVLNPGLYCITGGISFGANSTVTGNGVTLYFLNGADYSAGASVSVTLIAPTVDAPPAVRGLLMYGDPSVTNTFILYGGATTTYQGTIYFPNGAIDAQGGENAIAYKAQFVAKRVDLGGSVDMSIDFDSGYCYQIPATLSLQQ